MHVSNPIGEMKIVEGSRFVNEMGRMAKKYMDEKIHTINRKKELMGKYSLSMRVRFYM